MVTGPTSYDEVPYDNLAFAQTHPDRLATTARMFGLQPPPITTARVLELGCASGGNLIPMAFNLPDGEFVGIDLSRRHVDTALSSISALEMRNIHITHSSILDIDDSWGRVGHRVGRSTYSTASSATACSRGSSRTCRTRSYEARDRTIELHDGLPPLYHEHLEPPNAPSYFSSIHRPRGMRGPAVPVPADVSDMLSSRSRHPSRRHSNDQPGYPPPRAVHRLRAKQVDVRLVDSTREWQETNHHPVLRAIGKAAQIE
jgi:hypothetical protein